MFTDIVGYTALMESDEKAALAQVNMHQQTLNASVAMYEGEVIDYYGDGSLSIFDSVYDAVQCAREVQLGLKADVPLRIGLHIGEIVEKEGDIFGDGVNVASRIESAGVAGSILLSRYAYDKVKNQSDFDFVDLGSFQFKNVAEPMRVYALSYPGMPDISSISRQAISTGSNVRRYIIAGLVAAVLLMGVWIVSTQLIGPKSNKQSGLENAPDLNTIAVFPFEISGDEELQYLREGLVDVFSTKIDGIAGLNSIDPNVTIARARDFPGTLEPLEYASISSEVGAGEFILGNLLRLGDKIRIKISEYSNDGKLINDAEAIVPSESEILGAIDKLVLETIAQRYTIVRQDIIASSILMSDDLRAVKAFLVGEELRRNGYFEEASQSYVQAISIDSAMSMAWIRMDQVCSWTGICPYDQSVILENGLKYSGNLPAKMREFAQYSADKGLIRQPEGVRRAQELIDKYGENVDFLILLGESIFHSNAVRGESALPSLNPFLKAYRYDPNNTEVLYHIIQQLLYLKDAESINEIAMDIPESSRLWPVTQCARLLIRNASWTEDEVQVIADHPGFDFELVFFICRTEKNVRRVLELRDDLELVIGEELRDRTVPTHALMHYWQGQESEAKEYMKRDVLFSMITKYAFPVVSNAEYPRYGVGFEDPWGGPLESGAENGVFPDDFALAIRALHTNDPSQYQRFANSLRELSGEEGKYERYLMILRAMMEHYNSRFALSNQIIDSVMLKRDGVPMPIPEGFIRQALWTLRAENFAALGEIDQAIEQYRFQYEYLDGGDDLMLGCGWVRRAELLEQTGQYNEAQTLITWFLDLYQDCDNKFEPWVEKAEVLRQRINAQLN